MPIKVFIRRHIKVGREEEAIAMLYHCCPKSIQDEYSASVISIR